MKKYVVLIVAVLLLIVDIRVPAVAYPVFEEFRTEAPETVDLIINHVVGDHLRIDLLSDTLGYVLLAITAIKLIGENTGYRKTLLWSAFSLGIYIYQNLMPFLLNGNERFRIGYLIYFVAVFLEAMVIFRAVYPVCTKLETVENHRYNNITIIILLISVGTGFVAEALYFFDLIVLSVIYLIIQLVTMIVCWYRIFQNRKLLLGE
ncbi:MAG: hypothetical protein IJ409_01270 [Lachnospiraceae bacterium]|nr:hypothetical protein [Lachnospiraceae bacterium]